MKTCPERKKRMREFYLRKKCNVHIKFIREINVPAKKSNGSIFADYLKYFVAGPKLSTITTKLQQSMDDLAAHANQWRIGLNAGKTSKLLFQHSTRYPWLAHHTTRQGHLLCHLLPSLSTPPYPSPTISMLLPTLLVTVFSNSYLYLPPPMGHHHPPPSDCLTFTSLL